VSPASDFPNKKEREFMKKMKNKTGLFCILIVSTLCGKGLALEVSSFCKAQVPGTYILPAEEGSWTWGMAPIYDEDGKLHVFNSIIPKNGSWIKNSKISHWVADGIDGPYTLVGDVFSSDHSTYHNPQVSKVGDTYVLVFLMNHYKDEDGSKQEVGLATAKSLDGPWTESALNPVIPASGILHGANINHASNPSFVATPDGKFRIYYKVMTDKYPVKKGFREIAFAVSDQIEGPYVNYEGNPVISYADQQLDIEDPYAFYYNGMYYMITEDRLGVADMLDGVPPSAEKGRPGGFRPGLIYQSKDGIHWDKPKVGYQTNEIYFGDKLARSERPSILWKDGKPECLFLACHDEDPTAGYFVRIQNWEGE
jgi:hypothetical protein